MQLETIIYAVEGSTARITLNRPHRLNAVTRHLYDEMMAAMTAAESNTDVRAIVLTGSGRAFCVGADLKEHGIASRTAEQKRDYASAEQEICFKIQNSAKPFVAAVNGYALGAGAEIALSCDFVVMRSDAEMGFPEISIGTYLGGGLTYILPRLVGLAKAKELIFLGRRINGDEAATMGLIYRSASADRFDSELNTLLERLALLAPIPLGMAKSHLHTHHRTAPEAALQAEADALLRCMDTHDWEEGIRAFNEKRKPVFTGR